MAKGFRGFKGFNFPKPCSKILSRMARLTGVQMFAASKDT